MTDKTHGSTPVPGPVSGTRIPDGYARDVGRLMYLWGWPMANLHNRKIVFSQVAECGLGDGVIPLAPLNRLTMLTDYIKPEERSVATPNQDTVYGFGLLSLDLGPVVFQVPDFGDRFWIYQLGNQRTDAIGAVGRPYDTKPGFYFVCGPNFDGQPPKGISGVFRSDTDIAYIIPRAFMDDTADDRVAIRDVIRYVLAYPATEFDGTMKDKDWTAIPTLSDPSGGASTGGGETQWVDPSRFFDELPHIVDEVPPLAGEEALYGLFRSVLDAAAHDPSIAIALHQAAIDADRDVVSELHRYYYAGVPVANGWVSPMNGANWGADYFSRTAAAKSNIFCNARRESAYFNQEYDSKGERLNGSNAYIVTFAKGETPPVRGFWSLSLYNDKHFFDANSINRFSVGTKNKNLRFADDGSLTIYVQHDRPDGDFAANWLPAPAGDFELFIRAYWPEDRILSRDWAAPPIERRTD
jgi:hypothetical protein